MHIQDEPEIPPQINIVPMIDVIFAILTFFIMSTLFLTRSEGLPVNLPQAATTETQTKAQINVTVTPDGEIALNRKPIDLSELEGAVRQMIEPNSQALVVINADEAVEHGRVVSVMDRLRRIEGAKLAIAAQKS
ncbi:MAG: biopolymer transporter ExbD [Coleofasciculaceae cyanobacterium]